MDEQDLDQEFDEPGDETQAEANAEIFYWALKNALERTSIEAPPTTFS